jgi:AcrR family transcriptional regulator
LSAVKNRASEETGEPQNNSRRSRKKEQTRRSIFSAAMALFAAKDYDTVTIEEICDRADVAKATFFLHFPNKAALLTEFNERLTADLKARLQNVDGSAEEKLRFLAQSMQVDWERNAEIMRKMVGDFLNQPSLPKAATQANASILDLIASIIKEGQAAGELQAHFAPNLVAGMLIASWGAFVSAWVINNPNTPENAGEEVLDIILNGLKA